MNKQHFLLNEVARLVGRKPYQIAYLITTGVIPEPKLRINNKRVFTPDEIAQVRAVFERRAVKESEAANG